MKAAALALALAATPAAAEPCAVALILALDVSGSVDPREWALQTGGIADAFRTPELREAALALGGPLHIAVTQWTGAGRQTLSAPWRPLADEAALDAFASEVETLPRASTVSLLRGIGPACLPAERPVVAVPVDIFFSWSCDPLAPRS